MSNSTSKTTRELVRIGGRLKEIVKVFDSKGALLHQTQQNVMVEFYFHDFIQVIVGSMLLAIPVGFTQEVWELGYLLSWWKIGALFVVSLLFIGVFHYYNFYQNHFKDHKEEFFTRLIVTYCVAFIAVGCLLYLINQAPWLTETVVALKRTIIVALPASLSAAVADMIK